MAIISDFILRGTRGTQPAASVYNEGFLYFVTDEYVLERSNGSAWQGYSGSALRTITLTVDGGGTALATGVVADLYVPFDATIVAVRALADQSGSVVVDIWKDTYANFPPTDADTITASAPVTISTATKSEDTTLTGWTVALAAGNTLRFNVDSVTTITRVTITLSIIVTGA